MNKPVIISADSTCDLPPELLEKYSIKTIPLTILLGEKSFPDSTDYSPEIMYARYRQDGMLPKTSAPGIQQFLDFFSAFTDAGYEVVHLDISSELSSTCSNAMIAASELGSVYVVDSRMLSSGIALLALEAADCRDAGMRAADICKYISALTAKVDTSFVLDTLEFLWKGGRCSGLAALGANLLKLKPALEMKDGKLEVYKKYRGNMKNVYAQYIKERIAGKAIRKKHVFLTTSGEIPKEHLDEYLTLISDLTGAEKVHCTFAGCTVSSHCGPACLGVLFINE